MHSADLVLFGTGLYLCCRGAERQTDGLPLKIQKEQRDVRLLQPFFSCHSEAKSGDGLILHCPEMS